MRRALVLHLYYEDVALDLLARIAPVDPAIDVFVTGPLRGSRKVVAGLKKLGAPVEWVEAPAFGFDIAPFLAVLRILADRGYDIFAKLHTKSGGSGYGDRWREAGAAAVAGSPAVVADLSARFAATPDLAMAGPADLYLSAEINMLRNGRNVMRLAGLAFPGEPMPRDWGFFAGTMFWGRVAAFAPLVRLLDPSVAWEEKTDRDGQVAHAVERLFGLAARRNGGAVLAVDAAGRAAQAVPRRVPILTALVGLGLPDDAPEPTEVERMAIRKRNPLAAYIAAGSSASLDPNPLFSARWYLPRARIGPRQTPLAAYLASGPAGPDPSPRFNRHLYLRDHPWLARLPLDPLAHLLSQPDWRETEPVEIDEVETDWRMEAGDPDAVRLDRGDRRFRLSKRDVWSVAIKIAAPRSATTEWGDVHFAGAFAAAFERLGHRTRVDRPEEWSDPRRDRDDVAIWLRGPEPTRPDPAAFNVLWNISHPDQVGYDEMEKHDFVLVASESYAAFLRTFLRVPVLALLQATDPDRFRPPAGPTRPNCPVLFVGNRRGEDRPVLRWAIEAGLRPEIHGGGWRGFVPDDLLHGGRIANAELPERYAGAAAVLNDHWPAMRDFGFVSNRPLDVVAAGGVPVSDAMPGIAAMLGDAVIEVPGPAALPSAVEAAKQRPWAERTRLAAEIRERHSFDRRAETLLRALRPDRSAGNEPAPRHVHLVHAGELPGHRAFADVIAPLTLDDAGPLRLTATPLGAPMPKADAVIVEAEAIAAGGAAKALLSALPKTARLLIDDRRGCGVPASLTRRAVEIWDAATAVPGGPLAAAIDPRIWRDYHRPPHFAPGRTVKLAVFSAGGHLDAVLAAAAEVAAEHPGRLELWLPPELAGPEADWVRPLVAPEEERAYPRHARWLRGLKLDAAVCLGSVSDADRAFLEAAAHGLVPIMAREEWVPGHLALTAEPTKAGIAAALSRLVETPRPLAAIAAAATDHVWRKRRVADLGARLAARLFA